MDRTALLVIDAQQEYFAPTGKVPLPDGPRAVERIAQVVDWARRQGVPVFNGFIAEVKSAGEIMERTAP